MKKLISVIFLSAAASAAFSADTLYVSTNTSWTVSAAYNIVFQANDVALTRSDWDRDFGATVDIGSYTGDIIAIRTSSTSTRNNRLAFTTATIDGVSHVATIQGTGGSITIKTVDENATYYSYIQMAALNVSNITLNVSEALDRSFQAGNATSYINFTNNAVFNFDAWGTTAATLLTLKSTDSTGTVNFTGTRSAWQNVALNGVTANLTTSASAVTFNNLIATTNASSTLYAGLKDVTFNSTAALTLSSMNFATYNTLSFTGAGNKIFTSGGTFGGTGAVTVDGSGTSSFAGAFTSAGDINIANTGGVTFNEATFNAVGKTVTVGASNPVTITGGGLTLAANTSAAFNSVITGGSAQIFTNTGSVVTFNADATLLRFTGAGTVNIADGVTYTATYVGNEGTTGWSANLTSRLNIGTGAQLKVYSGLLVYGTGGGTSNIEGSMLVSGGTSASSNYYSIRLGGVLTFGANASLDQTQYSTLQKSYLSGTLNSNVATAGAIKFANVLQIYSGAKIVMNTTNGIISGYGTTGVMATSQADSTFALISGTSTFEINAENDIGTFDFLAAATVLNLKFGASGSLDLQGFDNFDNGSVYLDGEILHAFKIYTVDEADLEAYKAHFTSSTGDVYFEKISDGVYWVNTVVPEPAEWAAIFGAFALGLALWRRKRS